MVRIFYLYITLIAKRLISLLHLDIFRGPSMKDECISNSSVQQPSPAIQSSSPTPTLRPSPLSALPSMSMDVLYDDGTSSVSTGGPTADASISPTDDVSERNAFYDLRCCFHSQFLLIDFSLNTTRFLHRRGMMITILIGLPLNLCRRLQQVHQSQLLLHHQPIYQLLHPLLQHPTVSKLKLFMMSMHMKHLGNYID